MKRIIVTILILALAICFTACGEEKQDEEITVVSREDGAGTRDSFNELTGVKENTVDTAEISNSTAVVIQSVAGNKNAIGYISMGAVDDSVKVLNINGVPADNDRIKNGSYELQRSLNIVTKGKTEDLVQDFINYIMSAEGQTIIEEEGYITVKDGAEPYVSKELEGTITIAGSTSVAPVIEAIAEEYKKVNKKITIEIQQIGSSAGIQSVKEGLCDIGMASRELKTEEKGLKATPIAIDGIAVIVNSSNSIKDISMDQLRDIFTGKITKWSEIK